MHIISRKRLLTFCQQHADAFTPIDDWFRTAKAANWENFNDVRQIYPSADAVGNFTVFNIKGNDYRLVVSINYEIQIIFIKYVLTHSEYNKEKWKNDPYF
ncbi:MAG TPA: type II toxin-antitoxin system HigB family toxin [Oculatellaceae cyanobacterium]|jgi:mRNA interferase HigB